MTENQQNDTLFEIQVNHESRSYFYEMAKWCKFLSIMGFIGIGIMVLLGLTMGSIMSSLSGFGGNQLPLPSFFFTIVYLLIAALYFYPVFCMYKFSTLMKKGLNENNQSMFNNGLSNLKSMFKFMGILTLGILIFYALIIVIVALTGVANS